MKLGLRLKRKLAIAAFLVSLSILAPSFFPSARAQYFPPSWGGTQSWTNNYYGNCYLGYTTGQTGSLAGDARPNCNGVEAVFVQDHGSVAGSSSGSYSATYSDFGPSTSIDGSGHCGYVCQTFYITQFNQGNTEVDISPNLFVLGSQAVDSEVVCTPFGCLGGANTDTSVELRLDVIQDGVCSPAGCTPNQTVYSNDFINEGLHCTNNGNTASCKNHINYDNTYNPNFVLYLSPGQYYTVNLYFNTYASLFVAGAASGTSDTCFQVGNCNNSQIPQNNNCPTGSQPNNGNCLYVEWKSTSYTVHYPGFNLGSNPGSVSFNAGSSATSTISVSSINNFNDVASLTATSDDPNFQLSLSPASVTPSGGTAYSTLTVSDPATCDSGSHIVTVTGTATENLYPFAQSFSVSTTIPVSVSRTCDFGISSNPSSLTIRRGQTGTTTISVSSVNAFSGSVSIVATTPAGVTATYGTNPVSVPSGGSATSVLTLKVAKTAVRGTYTITVTGTGPYSTHSTTITLTVT